MKKMRYVPETDRFLWTNEEIDFSVLTACLHIGYACNLHCPYCFNLFVGEAIVDSGDQALFSAFSRLGLKRLVVSGGEPFLYRERLYRLLQTAKQYEIATLVSTNGTLLDKTVIEHFLPVLDFVDISLPATTKEGYLTFRKFDGFSLATNAIRDLLEAGVKVRLTYTVDQNNYHEALKLPELVERLGVKNVRIGYVYGSDGSIETPLVVDKIVADVEKTGVLTYRPINGERLMAYQKGYLVMRLDGNAYLALPKKENWVTNIIGKDRLALREVFYSVAQKQRILFGE